MDTAQLTFPVPIEPVGLTILLILTNALLSFEDKMTAKAKAACRKAIDLLKPYCTVWATYERVHRPWIQGDPNNPQQRGRLDWDPKSPLSDLGPVAFWTGLPHGKLNGQEIAALLKETGLQFDPKDLAAMEQEFPQWIFMSGRSTPQNRIVDPSNPRNVRALKPSQRMYAAHNAEYHTKILNRPARAPVGSGASDIDQTGPGDDDQGGSAY